MSEPLRASPVAAIEEAREAARRNGGNFIQALEARLDGSTEQWLEALGEYFRYPTLDMAALERLESVFEQVPLREAMERLCVVLRDPEGRLLCAFADPTATGLQTWVEARTGVALDWHLAHPADLRVFLARHEEGMHALESAVTGHHAAASAGTVEEVSLQTIGEDINPVIRLVNSTIYDAMKAGASDIHLEAHARGMAIKYRIDGVLSVAGEVADPAIAEQVISRIKVLSELDIAERRIPQDGRFKVRVRGREIDFRVSIMPSIFGEDSVIRILDKESLAGAMSSLRLDALGFDPKALAVLRRLAAEPYGMLLVTGPTGSGKTTTLYAALSEINTGEEKIVTIEDPVEYQVPGVLQIPVNEKKGLTFARGLRSILRHDPDKIMVGEIRDPETAEIAVQSALTGHLVFTTVHANNVFDVLGRFIHMGVDPFSFVSALNGIVAQRLVRLVCRACAQPITPASDLLEASGIPQGSSYSFLEGRGCGQCRGTGYRGRKAIAEYMVLNDELRELIVARTSIRELKEAAARSGTLSLRQAALAAVAAGQTTLAEVNRVTFVG
ncbi:MAG: type II/IV secretion system protein [Betaproteobacteria bacterium]|nr:type II/IV secretion system protein [Betaproteobacteria bacterium]